MATQSEQLFDVFKTFPEGLAVHELATLADGINPPPKASALISFFVDQGLAVKSGRKINPATGNNVTIYAPSGKNFADRVICSREPRRKRRGPFESEVKQLRAWKLAAIARFPELGIDPAIIKARTHVAKILRDEGNNAKAVMVELGELDGGEMMRAVADLFKG